VVYIYAKAQSGPPMPLAVVKKTLADLPLNIRLSDSMAMVPTMKLSDFSAWTIIARIAPSGSATPQADDIQVQALVHNKAQAKKLIILNFK
jgi:cytochrome c-type biogenesis protein CcmH